MEMRNEQVGVRDRRDERAPQHEWAERVGQAPRP